MKFIYSKLFQAIVVFAIIIAALLPPEKWLTPLSLLALAFMLTIAIYNLPQLLKPIRAKWQTGFDKIEDENTPMEWTYFTVIEWNVLLRPLLSCLAAVLTTIVLYTIFDVILNNNAMSGLTSVLSIIILTVLYGLNDTKTNEPEYVPEAHGAMLTFWGSRFQVYRTEGRYSWTGRRFGLGRSQTNHSPDGTDENGFIKLRQWPYPVWDRADSKVKDIRLTSLASDNSVVTTTLTLTLWLANAMKWLNTNDPALDLGEQVRHAFRTIISFFTGVDCASIKNVFVTLMEGHSIVTGFIIEDVKEGGLTKGSMVRDKAGTPLYTIIDKSIFQKIRDDFSEKSPKALAKAIRAKEDELKNTFIQEHLIGTDFIDNSGVPKNVAVAVRTVQSSFVDTRERLGIKLLRAAVGDIDLSETVKAAANQAASEVFERRKQIASARTYADSIEIMATANKEHPISDLEKAIAAAQDNENVQIVVTGGGDSLKDTAATHATLSKNSKGGSKK